MASTSVARTGGNLPGRNFIPEVWSVRMQAKFYANTVTPQITNTDWEGEIKDAGSVVYIRVVPSVQVDDYVVNEDLDYQDLDDEKLQLTIDRAKKYAFKIDDVDKAQMDISVMEKASKDAQKNMKIVIDRDVLTNVHGDATTDLGTLQITKINVLEWIVDAETELDELNVPEEGRWGVLAPWICGLIRKSDLKDASLSGDSKSLLRGGAVGMISNFTLYKNNLLDGAYTATSGAPTHAMFGTKHAITFASQFVKTERIPQLQNTFGSAVRGLNVYGYKVVKKDALVDAPAYK